MSAWRWACEVETCGSVTLQFLTRKKAVLCRVCGHISETLRDRDTGEIVLVSERRFPDTGLVEDREANHRIVKI